MLAINSSSLPAARRKFATAFFSGSGTRQTKKLQPLLHYVIHGTGETDKLDRLTHRDVFGQQPFLIERHGGVQVCLQTLAIVAVAHGQHQAVGQSDQDVPRSPGDRLVTMES